LQRLKFNSLFYRYEGFKFCIVSLMSIFDANLYSTEMSISESKRSRDIMFFSVDLDSLKKYEQFVTGIVANFNNNM